MTLPETPSPGPITGPTPPSVPIPGPALRELRGYEGQSQAEYAARLGTSQQSIGAWEKTGVPFRHRTRVRSILGESELAWAQAVTAGEIDPNTVDPNRFHIEYYEGAEFVESAEETAKTAAAQLATRAVFLRGYSEQELLTELMRRSAERDSTQ